MANTNSTTSYLDPPQLIGRPNADGTISITPLELKKLNDYNYYVAKMLQGGLNLANLNSATNQTFTDTNGNVAELALTAMGLELDVGNLEGDFTNLSVTVDGMRIADETGSYTIIDGDKIVSKDHATGIVIVIQDGEIIIGESAYGAVLKFDGTKVVLDSSLAPMKISTLMNMSIDVGGTLTINGNPYGAAVFT